MFVFGTFLLFYFIFCFCHFVAPLFIIHHTTGRILNLFCDQFLTLFLSCSIKQFCFWWLWKSIKIKKNINHQYNINQEILQNGYPLFLKSEDKSVDCIFSVGTFPSCSDRELGVSGGVDDGAGGFGVSADPSAPLPVGSVRLSACCHTGGGWASAHRTPCQQRGAVHVSSELPGRLMSGGRLTVHTIQSITRALSISLTLIFIFVIRPINGWVIYYSRYLVA